MGIAVEHILQKPQQVFVQAGHGLVDLAAVVVAGGALVAMPTGPLASVLIGIIFIITIYNLLPDAFSEP